MKKESLGVLFIFLIIVLLVVSYMQFETSDNATTSFPTPSGQRTHIDVYNLDSDCEVVGQCKDLIAIDCNADVDGPFYYIEAESGEIIEKCGGFCELPDPDNGICADCPPESWTCEPDPY